MKPPAKKPLPKKRNLAAKALRSPLFKPKVEPDPKAHKRTRKVDFPADDDGSDDQIN